MNGSYSIEVCPNKEVDLFVTSLGRSGNTFAAEIVHELFANKTVASHGHSIASLKLARKYCVPTLVLVRNPLDVVSSYVVKMMQPKSDNKRNVNYVLTDYIEYYRYVLKNINKFEVLKFAVVIKNPEVVVNCFEKYGIRSEAEFDIKVAVDKVIDKLQNDDRPYGERNLSNKYKEEKKNVIKKFVEENKKYSVADELYNNIIVCL